MNPIINYIFLFIVLIVFPLISIDICIFVFCSPSKRVPVLLVSLFVELLAIKILIFPTWWKYPDKFIDTDVVGYWDVQEIYGDFDIEQNNPYYKAYYIYTDFKGNKHYYYMRLDSEGFISIVGDKIIDDNGVVLDEDA